MTSDNVVVRKTLYCQGMEQREDILRLVLREEAVREDTDIASLSRQTEGFSGSDLLELCRTASVYRLRHLLESE